MIQGEDKTPSLPAAASGPESLAKESPIISSEKLKQLYAMLLKLRSLAEHESRNPRKRRIARNLEACEVACAVDLKPEDTLAVIERQPLLYPGAQTDAANVPLNSGLPLNRDIACHVLKASRVGDRLALATGAAFLYQKLNTNSVVVAFAEKDEISQSRSSISYALENSFPIVYVQLGEGARRVPGKGRTHPLPTVPVDRSDVVAIYRVAYEAIEKARRGAGPTLIQCLRYELQSQANPSKDGHSGDPLCYMEQYLRRKDLWSEDFKTCLLESFSGELKTAFQASPRNRSRRSSPSRASRER